MKTVDRIYKYIEYKRINASKLEKTIGLSNGYLGKQLKRNADIGESILNKILENCPEINPQWLMTGVGQMLRADSTVIATIPGKGIPLIPTDAFAGYGTPTFDDLKIEEYYYVREFKQADFLIRIKGNSMYPKYSSGDIVACKLVKERLFFQWNKIYAIHTDSQGVMVKRVQQSAKNESITLVSDNEKYKPFDVPLSDVLAVALVIGVISVE